MLVKAMDSAKDELERLKHEIKRLKDKEKKLEHDVHIYKEIFKSIKSQFEDMKKRLAKR